MISTPVFGAEASADATNQGLAFPGSVLPTYMDFVYFSFTDRMTFQVSDVQITAPAMRGSRSHTELSRSSMPRAILALTINMVGGLI